MDCAICLDTVCEHNKAVLLCNHIFCETCILDNLHHLKNCPLCRKPLVIASGSVNFKKIINQLQNKIKDLICLIIKIICVLLYLISFIVWISLIACFTINLPNFLEFILGYITVCIVISRALVYVDKVLKLNALTPHYMNMM